MDVIESLLRDTPIPRVAPVRQTFDRPVLQDPAGELSRRMREKRLLGATPSGNRIAIGVGSRGVSNQVALVHALVSALRGAGADPFLVPAMGSHGGATADGQRSMLEEMGFIRDIVDAPIRASMEVVQIGSTENGLPVYLDRLASEADGIVVINRIKPHVAFRGPFESGLMKMITIGLGKQKGAEICHDLGFGRMAENIPAIARVAIQKASFLFGVGIIENSYHETCGIEVLRPDEIEREEPKLLARAKALSPRLLFDQLDVLVLDEIGKDISGTGFDTNVVGRFHTPYAKGGPDITRISVLDLTDKSHGNANGLGIVDFTTRRAFGKVRFDQTYPNSLTSTVPASVKIPMVLDSDRQAIQAAIRTCNILDKRNVRLARIKNTISLETVWVSEPVLADVATHSNLERIGDLEKMRFDDSGNLF